MAEGLDWKQLGFSYRKTAAHIVYEWKNGTWGLGQLKAEPTYTISIAATALHYGQSAFEGLKAFHTKSGAIQIFRPHENARRMQRAAERTMMPSVPESIFVEAVKRVVEANKDYIPPYGTGGSLYIRPLLFGSGAEIGLGPAKEYTFIVLVTPVGAYFKDGVKAYDAMVIDEYDRAAPLGVGHVKLAGNYASSLLPGKTAKDLGFPLALYLDAKEHRYIDEFGTSNFIGIKNDGSYVTPQSRSILPSITNLSLMDLARDLGIKVEQRPILFEELPTFTEVGACGTAVVISPVRRIVRGKHEIMIRQDEGLGPVLKTLYDRLQGIQYGVVEDRHKWMVGLD